LGGKGHRGQSRTHCPQKKRLRGTEGLGEWGIKETALLPVLKRRAGYYRKKRCEFKNAGVSGENSTKNHLTMVAHQTFTPRKAINAGRTIQVSRKPDLTNNKLKVRNKG